MNPLQHNIHQRHIQQHLQRQREYALQLFNNHNRLLSRLLGDGSAPTFSATMQHAEMSPAAMQAAQPVAGARQPAQQHNTPVDKGKVISLFDYKSGKVSSTPAPSRTSSAAVSSADEGHAITTDGENIIFKEDDAEALKVWGDTIDAILADFGGDDALAIHRKILAGYIFLNSTKDAFFYHAARDGVIMALCYVGPEQRYDDILKEIIDYAQRNDLVLNIMAQENRVESLSSHGLSTTPVGIWQRIEPLADFTLGGTKMRRLRYIVNKYKKMGDVKTISYVPGTTPEVDQEICDVMDEWVRIKEADPPFVPMLKQQIMAGTVSSNHVFYLTYRDGRIDNVIILSVDNLNNGYLMDAEFYIKDLPLGSTEFAITEMIESFKQEDKQVLSLGLTLGTGLYEHDNRSQEVHDLYAALKKTEYVNGDANAQYKNKYRPQCVTVFMARPLDAAGKKLNDLMIMLGQG